MRCWHNDREGDFKVRSAEMQHLPLVAASSSLAYALQYSACMQQHACWCISLLHHPLTLTDSILAAAAVHISADVLTTCCCILLLLLLLLQSPSVNCPRASLTQRATQQQAHSSCTGAQAARPSQHQIPLWAHPLGPAPAGAALCPATTSSSGSLCRPRHGLCLTGVSS